MKIKPAPTKFAKNGFDIETIKRHKDIILCKLSKEGIIFGYEVHKIRIAKICGLMANAPAFKGFSHYEQMAGNEDFGVRGWSYQHYNMAIEKYDQLSKGGEE